MAQSPTIQTSLDFPGIVTDPNSQSVKLGSFASAKNVSIVRDNIVEVRRGMAPFTGIIPISTTTLPSRIQDLYYYDNVFFARTLDGTLHNWASSTWNVIETGLVSTYSDNTSLYRINKMFTDTNLYLCGGNFGVKRISDGAGTIAEAGVPGGLDGDGATAGASGWFTNDRSVNYTVLFGTVSSTNRLRVGAPSDIITVFNTAGATRTTTLEFTVPAGMVAGDIYQIYRSAISVDLATPAPSDVFFIFEGIITAGQITAKLITLADATPDSIRILGAPLYTNLGTGSGPTSANNRPPTCIDMCNFKDLSWYANTRSKQTANLTLLSVGATEGIQNGDTLTFTPLGAAAIVLTGSTAAENIATGTFFITTSGSIEQNIEDTTKSIIRVINRWAGNTFLYANSESKLGEIPGQILLNARTWDVAEFYITSSRTTAWFPTIAASGTAAASTNTSTQHFLRYSKPGESEAVPQLGTNFAKIGSENFPIIRVLPLANSIIIFKEGEGVWRLTGSTEQDFVVQSLNLTLELLGPKTAVLLNDSVLAYTSQGVVQIFDDGSAPLRSRNIETELRVLQNLENFITNSWGLAYETEKQYLLFVPEPNSDIYTTYVWNFVAAGKPWTTYRYELTTDQTAFSGVVTPITLAIDNDDRGRMFLAMANPLQNTSVASGALAYPAVPVNGNTVVVTGPGGGPYTFTYTGGAPGANEFTTIAGLEVLLEAVPSFSTAVVGQTITISILRGGVVPDSWTIIGTGAFSGISITFSGGLTANNMLYKERKSYTKADFVDEEWTQSLTSATGTTLTITAASTYQLQVGQIVTQFPNSADEIITKILSVTSQTVFVVEDVLTWDVAEAITIGVPISINIVQNKFNCNTPVVVKQFIELLLVFNTADFLEIDIDTSTDFFTSDVTQAVTPLQGGGYGNLNMGTGVYGGSGNRPQVVRTLAPQNSAMGHWINFGVSKDVYKNSFVLEGVFLTYVTAGTEFNS